MTNCTGWDRPLKQGFLRFQNLLNLFDAASNTLDYFGVWDVAGTTGSGCVYINSDESIATSEASRSGSGLGDRDVAGRLAANMVKNASASAFRHQRLTSI